MSKYHEIVENAKAYMSNENIDAWVLYDFKGSNPIFWRVIGRRLSTTRRCFLFVPKVGRPKILVNSLDKGLFDDFSFTVCEYSSRVEMERELDELLEKCDVIAMEYSPRANIPYIGRVDGGTVELFREKGVRVVSSGNLFQYSADRWTREELKAHLEASEKISTGIPAAARRDRSRIPG